MGERLELLGGRIGKADVRRLREFVARQPVSEPVIGQSRSGARY